MRKGFTLVELMIVVAIIGMLASICIPLCYWAYHRAGDNVRARNVVEVEKAKMILMLPENSVQGAMGLNDAEMDLASGSASSNLLMAMNINDLSALRVGDRSIRVGTLREKARYE